MNIKPLTSHIGAEITNIDLGNLDDQTFAGIQSAFKQHMVLVFRDQHLDREQHKAFGQRFGKLHVHPMNHLGTGDPEILQVKTAAKSAYTVGDA